MESKDISKSLLQTDAEQFTQSPPGLYALLESVRQRPAMYLGHLSLTNFRSWLYGYQMGKHDAGLPPSDEEKEFYGFDAFVQDKYDWHDVGGWAAKILYYHRNEHLALEEFFKLLDEFKELKRKERESDK